MRKNIFIFCGECATGKSSVEIALQKKINRVVSYTTRPKRSNEVDGVDYHFIADEEFEKMSKEGLFLEQTSYTVSGKLLKYGLPKKGFLTDVPNIIVLNPHGVSQVFENNPEMLKNGIVFYLKSKLPTRIDRYLNRETSSEKYMNLAQRLKQDFIDFEGFEDFLNSKTIDYLPVYNEGVTLQLFIKHIEELINCFNKEGI